MIKYNLHSLFHLHFERQNFQKGGHQMVTKLKSINILGSFRISFLISVTYILHLDRQDVRLSCYNRALFTSHFDPYPDLSPRFPHFYASYFFFINLMFSFILCLLLMYLLFIKYCNFS